MYGSMNALAGAATYVGMVVAVLWSAYHCVALIPCLCTLSASVFIEPSLHQLDFFLNLLDSCVKQM